MPTSDSKYQHDHSELDISDQLDIACVLYDHRYCISHIIQNIPPLTHELRIKQHNLISCGDIFDKNHRLRDKFLNVIANVSNGKPVEQLTAQDWKLIASRYHEWLLPPLSSWWRSAAYDSRRSLFARRAMPPA